MCGLAATGSTSDVFIYNPALDEWTRGAPVPIPGGADHCNVAAANGRLYLAGAIRIGRNFMDGKGPGAILPVSIRRGGAVEIYCTGLGATLPPAEGLERTRIIPQVEIGGRDAEVLFSGLSPGLFGVYPVNARVPLDSPTGTAVEVRLRAGGAGMGISGDPI